jgi:PAS domain S-box-containing protein
MDQKEKPGKELEQGLFASIIRYSEDAIISKTLDGTITSWNKGAEKIFGYTYAEVIGENISMLIPPGLRGNETEIIKKISEGKCVSHYKTERKKKNGEIINVSLTVSPVMDAAGNIIGASKILQDITEQLKTEKKLIASEIRFRDTLDNMLEGIQIHDFNWRYLYVNDALLKYSRYPKAELLGRTLMEKYPGIEQTELFRLMSRCMQERETIERYETEFIFPDGTKGNFQLSIRPVPEGIFLLSIDITNRKHAEEEIIKLNAGLEQKVLERTGQLENKIMQLKESEEKFQKAFQSSAAGITIIRLSDSIYLDVNDTFVQLTGYKKEELIGHIATGTGLVIDSEKRKKIQNEINKQGSIKNFELTILHKSGRIVDVLASIELVMLNGERCMINMIYDITERKKMEQVIIDSNKQLEEVNKELESFSYSVSHDLRTPVRAINGYARILEENYGGRLDSEGVKYLESILHNSQKMGQLIHDLLAFSRLGKKEFSLSKIDMNAVVNLIKSDLEMMDTIHRTEFIIHALPPARGDESLIKQVWINLLSNAIKYSKNKKRSIIEIGASTENNLVIYYVKDNGAGFNMEYYNKLFGVFSRLHSQEEFDGTGVGLAIVQKIIHRHKGTVWANSTLNEGACFYFSLPASN